MTRWAIAAGDFTPRGGMDRANHALARYLALSGRDVHLIAHRVWPDVAALPNVTVHHAARPLGSHLLGGPLLARAAAATSRRLGPATRLLSNGGNTRWAAPTWVHYLHAAYAPEVAAGARARISAAAGRSRFLEHEAATIAAAPAIICNSTRTAEDVRRCYGVDSSRLAVVFYGVDPVEFGPITAEMKRDARTALAREGGPLALFIGALGDRRKGFDLLFDAWRQLCADSSWDVDLGVVGVGAEAGAWQQRASAAGLARRISFLQFRADVPRVLAAADLVIHPSRYEAYGLGVHEALCRGLPAIVSASAGVAERIPDELKPLTLPDPLSVNDLVARLRLWRSDISGWGARAAAAGTALRGRSWDDMSADIAGIVEGRQ